MVFFSDNIAGIMGVKPDLNGIPNISPVWVVVLLLGIKRYLRHKGKCLHKVFKSKSSLKRVVVFDPHIACFCISIRTVNPFAPAHTWCG
jgi:hypothetical protein